MSVLHRREAASAPRMARARAVPAASVLDGLTAHALLALMAARLAVRVARHAIARAARPGRSG